MKKIYKSCKSGIVRRKIRSVIRNLQNERSNQNINKAIFFSYKKSNGKMLTLYHEFIIKQKNKLKQKISHIFSNIFESDWNIFTCQMVSYCVFYLTDTEFSVEVLLISNKVYLAIPSKTLVFYKYFK